MCVNKKKLAKKGQDGYVTIQSGTCKWDGVLLTIEEFFLEGTSCVPHSESGTESKGSNIDSGHKRQRWQVEHKYLGA